MWLKRCARLFLVCVLLIVVGIAYIRLRPTKSMTANGRIPSNAQSTIADSQEHREMVEMNSVPESKRHAAGDVEKKKLPSLEIAIATQEQIIVEKRKALMDVVRTQGIVYNPTNPPKSEPLTVEQIEQIKKKGHPYVDAKNDLEREVEKLNAMKQKLSEERAKQSAE